MVGSRALDARLEMAAGNVNGAGDVTLVPLVLLPDVEDERAAGVDQLTRLGRVHLRDLGADLLEQLAVRRHRYRKYSFAPSASVVRDECSRFGSG